MIRLTLAAIAVAWLSFASTPAAAAACRDVNDARPKDLADFCSAMEVVETYLSTYASQNPGKNLPTEASRELNAFIPAYLNRAGEYDSVALLVNLAPKLDEMIQSAEAPVLNDSEVRSALGSLRATLNDKLYQVTVSEAGLLLDLVLKIAKEKAAPSVIPKDPGLVTKARSTIDALAALMPADDTYLGQVQADAVALIGKVTLGTPALIQDGLAANPKVVPDLKKLRSTIDKVTVALTPRIHIYYAYFGDIGASPSGRRVCDATSTMRGRCEAGMTCKLPDAFETQLCGYNPVQYVEARDRGAVISYDCQIGGEDLWTRNVRIRPGKLMESDMPKPVILQSTEMEIACARTP
ncbi:hypothetical protein EOA23_00945 [Mesorhizobium sp. M2A.F.Ca.ET.042.01.1.1]|uniref:hypothetical protein n=1 Tax=Mesorhizobium sp. M2A.F.Ca.ET.042.01.1.1 TaxID=2496745 RepID=UPI000FCAF6DA|nr:hypothetical protein [Mesorhizobium sp. M2A.F.Ca.ET.042.01.1.1]RUX34646.1 hypothetical protein EOA23_00945 [Mesorhizobium sp. M2A.F.Ca.ET.042.01.1.1]